MLARCLEDSHLNRPRSGFVSSSKADPDQGVRFEILVLQFLKGMLPRGFHLDPHDSASLAVLDENVGLVSAVPATP